MRGIQEGYQPIPYHNQTHGIDVCQTTYSFVMSCGLQELADLGSLDLGAIIIGTTIHDFEHFGYNNAPQKWIVIAQCQTYNDQSVCENHHIAAAFQLLKDKSRNIFKLCSQDDFKALRKRIVSMVLATDMSKHFDDINRLKTMEVDPSNEEDKIFLMSIAVHMADLSNPTKQWLISLKWGILVYEEFF